MQGLGREITCGLCAGKCSFADSVCLSHVRYRGGIAVNYIDVGVQAQCKRVDMRPTVCHPTTTIVTYTHALVTGTGGAKSGKPYHSGSQLASMYTLPFPFFTLVVT